MFICLFVCLFTMNQKSKQVFERSCALQCAIQWIITNSSNWLHPQSTVAATSMSLFYLLAAIGTMHIISVEHFFSSARAKPNRIYCVEREKIERWIFIRNGERLADKEPSHYWLFDGSNCNYVIALFTNWYLSTDWLTKLLFCVFPSLTAIPTRYS